MGIGSTFAASIIKEGYADKNPFWDPYSGTPQYSLLNQVKVPDETAIRNYQIAKIRECENAVMESKFSSLDGIGTENFQTVINSFESDEAKKINEKIEHFVTTMNRFYWASRDEEKSQNAWKYLQNALKALEKSLMDLMSELNISTTNEFGNRTVMGETLMKVQTALNACGITSFDSKVVNEFLKNVNQMKGDTLEELGVAFFRKLNIPNIESIRLGSVYLNTDGRKGRHKGQLIQDLIAFDVTSPDILNDIEVEYKPVGSDQYIKAPLSKLFADIEAANGGNKQISITDETYDVLTNLQSINIQAKSGKNQLPWNQNASTSVAIGEYGEDNLDISVRRTFQLLSTLNNAENEEQPWSVKDSSSEYNALANYGLATVMHKVLHLSEEGNQYVLTPYGFMTFSKRMEQLLKTENYIALIQGSIVLEGDKTLTDKRKVGITKG